MGAREPDHRSTSSSVCAVRNMAETSSTVTQNKNISTHNVVRVPSNSRHSYMDNLLFEEIIFCIFVCVAIPSTHFQLYPCLDGSLPSVIKMLPMSPKTADYIPSCGVIAMLIGCLHSWITFLQREGLKVFRRKHVFC